MGAGRHPPAVLVSGAPAGALSPESRATKARLLAALCPGEARRRAGERRERRALNRPRNMRFRFRRLATALEWSGVGAEAGELLTRRSRVCWDAFWAAVDARQDED